MSIGLPCIATDCIPGGAALLIKDGENGLLVENDDNAVKNIEKIMRKKNYQIMKRK